MENIDKELAKFMSPEMVAAAMKIAEREGRDVSSVLNDAVSTYLRQEEGKSDEVMSALSRSMAKYDSVYQKLAK